MVVREKKTIKHVNLKGRRVLVRVDFNVPMDKVGNITDDTRIQASLPTIKYLLDKGCKVVLMSHLGRPQGKPVAALSLGPVAQHLSTLLGQPVKFSPEVVGQSALDAVADMKLGEIILLENLRFYPGEEADDPIFTRQLVKLGDLFVDDAFGTAHRQAASNVGVASYLPSVAGLLMDQEVQALNRLLENPSHPFVAILGGAKVSDKIGVITSLLERVDSILIGGGMANTFLKAQGHNVGDSLLEADKLELASDLLKQAAAKGVQFLLPTDVVIADSFSNEAAHKIVAVDAVPDGWRILDIGPQSVGQYATALAGSKMIVWNGPMGVFEMPNFAAGTVELAKAVAAATKAGAYSVVGGGDSVAAIEQAGLADQVSHISTGGGASLEFLEGIELPGVQVLQDLYPDPDFSTGVV